MVIYPFSFLLLFLYSDLCMYFPVPPYAGVARVFKGVWYLLIGWNPYAWREKNPAICYVVTLLKHRPKSFLLNSGNSNTFLVFAHRNSFNLHSPPLAPSPQWAVYVALNELTAGVVDHHHWLPCQMLYLLSQFSWLKNWTKSSYCTLIYNKEYEYHVESLNNVTLVFCLLGWIFVLLCCTYIRKK